jgi:hypothetical protein
MGGVGEFLDMDVAEFEAVETVLKYALSCLALMLLIPMILGRCTYKLVFSVVNK